MPRFYFVKDSAGLVNITKGFPSLNEAKNYASESAFSYGRRFTVEDSSHTQLAAFPVSDALARMEQRKQVARIRAAAKAERNRLIRSLRAR